MVGRGGVCARASSDGKHNLKDFLDHVFIANISQTQQYIKTKKTTKVINIQIIYICKINHISLPIVIETGMLITLSSRFLTIFARSVGK